MSWPSIMEIHMLTYFSSPPIQGDLLIWDGLLFREGFIDINID
jgi:hypothetical protein